MKLVIFIVVVVVVIAFFVVQMEREHKTEWWHLDERDVEERTHPNGNVEVIDKEKE
jgi:hypothetical protein